MAIRVVAFPSIEAEAHGGNLSRCTRRGEKQKCPPRARSRSANKSEWQGRPVIGVMIAKKPHEPTATNEGFRMDMDCM